MPPFHLLIEANADNPRGVAPVELYAIDRDRGGEQAKISKEECEKLRVLGYVENCDSVN